MDQNVDEHGTRNLYSRKAYIESIRIRDKPACRTCWAKYLCGGGCPAHAVKYSRNIHVPYGVGCELTRHRMHHAIQMYFWISRDHPKLLDHFLGQKGPGGQHDLGNGEVGATRDGHQHDLGNGEVGATRDGHQHDHRNGEVGATRDGHQYELGNSDMGAKGWSD